MTRVINPAPDTPAEFVTVQLSTVSVEPPAANRGTELVPGLEGADWCLYLLDDVWALETAQAGYEDFDNFRDALTKLLYYLGTVAY